MKRIIRHYVIDTFALFVISRIASGMVFEQGFQTLLFAGAGLTVISILVRPVINILLLPLNLVTFGLFRWVAAAIALYFVTVVIPGFKITSFSFAGLSTAWFDIPALNLGGFLAFIAFSFLLSVITSFVYWLVK